MERAHVLVRLRGDASASCPAGICRTSATTVRLEHSEMSPGVASITFEQVFDVNDTNSRVLQTSLTGAIDVALDGRAATLIATGATSSGKSFACHGNQQKPSNGQAEPGLITLAIRRIFSTLETKMKDGTKHNVLLSCWGVGRTGTGKKEVLTDLLATRTSVDVEDMESALVDRSVVVTTPAEAVYLYSRALGRVESAEKRDFVFALHVETLSKSGDARRGRLIVMDIHGGSIVEPRGGGLTSEVEKKERGQYFLDTQFPVHETLSAGFGAFVGNTSSTYLLVTIQTPAQFQQQAIQSLLYACKAKEIKSSSSVNYISAFLDRRRPNQLLETQKRLVKETENQMPGCREDIIVPEASQGSLVDPCAALSRRSSPLASPPLSTTSSDSTCELPFISPPPRVEDELTVSPSLSPSTSCESQDSLKQLAVSRRLRKAYDIAKAATSSPVKSSAAFTMKSNQSDEAVAHDVVDELLKHLPGDTVRRLTFQAKLEQIRTTQLELERALAHETSIKDKCVDRISRLSQTMSCQVVEHEQQLQEALTAKHVAEAQLQDLRSKFDDVGREVALLEDEIKALRAGQQVMTESSDVQSSANERALLHTLSARLEEAMIQAKDVITFKDGVIQSLEERLQLASKRGADAVTLLEDERKRFERDKAELHVQLQQSKESDNNKNEEMSQLRAANMAIQQQKAELTVKVAQLTLELETARSQWAREAHDREDRAEQKCAKQVTQAEQQLEQATTAMQQQMAQFRNELDMKVAKQRVATQVACKAGELKCDQLERELQRMKLKLAKQKLKMEKKTRALVASAHKQNEESVTLLEREVGGLSERLKIVLEREQGAVGRAKESEEVVVRLRGEMQQLQTSLANLERERITMGNLCKEIETDKTTLKTELELRIHEMEQSLAQQIMAAEARVHNERDDQVQKLIEQHNADMNRLRSEAKDRDKSIPTSMQLTRQHSISSAALSEDDGSLSSDSSRQQSINELDALINSKERRYRHFEKRRKASSSSRSSSSSPPTKSTPSPFKRALVQKEEEISELSARQKQLLAALATANEQETLAKKQIQESEAQRQNELARYEDVLQQLNSVKQENWNLSLALHVTEATNHQRRRELT